MRKIPKWLTIFPIVIITIVFLLIVSSIRITGKLANSPQRNIASLYTNWITYKNTTNKYTLQIPNTWEIREKKNISGIDSLVVFTPKVDKVHPSTLSVTSITVTSHSKPGQLLTTQSEFDIWYKRDPKEYDPTSRLNKLNIFTVGGEKAVIFIDSGIGSELKANGWSLVTWLRHSSQNYYIYTKGNAKITQGDITGYAHMLSTFRFYE